MQQIEIYNGSPRKNGNTSSLIEFFIQGLDRSKFLAKTTFLYDKKINPCTDCRICKTGNLVCKVRDDMQEVYNSIDGCDIMIIGTPIYWFGPTAKMKLLLDRLRPYYANKRLVGKKAILILPSGVGEKDCDLTIEMFSRAFNSLGVNLIGSITSKAYDIGDSEKDGNALKSISSLIYSLNLS